MNAPSVEELISAYLDGELDQAARHRVEKLLARSEEHRRLLAEMQAIRKLLVDIPPQSPSRGLPKRVAQRVEPHRTAGERGTGPAPATSSTSVTRLYLEQRRRQRRRWIFATSLLATTAGLLLMVWFGTRALPPLAVSHSSLPEEPPAAPSVAEVDPAGTERRSLYEQPQPVLEQSAPPESIATSSIPTPHQIPPIDAAGFRVFEAPAVAADDSQPAQMELASPVLEAGSIASPAIRRSPLFELKSAAGEVVLLLDQNHDAIVTDREVQHAAALFTQWSSMRRRPVEGRRLVMHLDQNNDDQLSEQEIRDGIAAARRGVPGAGREIAALLASLDRGADGRVGLEELQWLVARLGLAGEKLEPRLAMLLSRGDASGDGLIDAVESQFFADALCTGFGLQLPSSTASGAGPLALTYAAYGSFDRNRDGQLSQREAERGVPLSVPFEVADTSGDGLLTAGEYLDTLLNQLAEPTGTTTFHFRF